MSNLLSETYGVGGKQYGAGGAVNNGASALTLGGPNSRYYYLLGGPVRAALYVTRRTFAQRLSMLSDAFLHVENSQ